jgi:hypothetical protein
MAQQGDVLSFEDFLAMVAALINNLSTALG